jgi:alcohol dehydrogenase class IV
MITSFSFAPTPQLYFGTGKLSLLPGLIKAYGSTALLVTGAHSFTNTDEAQKLFEALKANGIQWQHYIIENEPSPTMIDACVQQFKKSLPSVVVAIGGGSVLDAGKAIAAMLPIGESIKDYLEGVGTKNHDGTTLPMIAIPTTSGTGSEATKNAVISKVGEGGYKKSLRHNNFIPKVAILDPVLTITCPPNVTAASGMDAFTQLLESYVSTAANPMTDALALEGLTKISKSLLKAWHDGDDMEARSDMALASYLSGITLANAGLGLVHGFASSVGGYFDIPNGVFCSSLMAAANKVTVIELLKINNNSESLKKYAIV